MKKLLIVVAFLTGILIGQVGWVAPINIEAHQSIQELWTDGIEAQGVAKDISFHMLIVTDDGEKQWHYFGSTAAEFPPTTADPVFEHGVIQFPRDLDELGDEATDFLYELGLQAGLKREGL